MAAHDNIPYAPSPPRVADLSPDSWYQEAVYSPDFEYEVMRRGDEHKAKARNVDHDFPYGNVKDHSRNASAHSTFKPGSIHTVISRQGPVPESHHSRHSSRSRRSYAPAPVEEEAQPEREQLRVRTSMDNRPSQDLVLSPKSSHERDDFFNDRFSQSRHLSRSRPSQALEAGSRPPLVYGPSFVRTSKDDGGASSHSQALVQSPEVGPQRDIFFDDGISVSDMTEREEMAETASRHVQFRVPDEVVDASEAWNGREGTSSVTGWVNEGSEGAVAW